MAVRFQIKDSEGNLLTLQLSENLTNSNGEWLPDDNTKVRGGLNWTDNPYKSKKVGPGLGWKMDAILQTVIQYTGRVDLIDVMTMYGVVDFPFFNSAGVGTLSSSGVQGTFKAGDMTWKKL